MFRLLIVDRAFSILKSEVTKRSQTQSHGLLHFVTTQCHDARDIMTQPLSIEVRFEISWEGDMGSFYRYLIVVNLREFFVRVI